MDAAATLTNTVAGLGFAVAFVLGIISARTHFCTLGAMADIANMGDWARMRMWVLAMAVALLGAQGLYAAEVIDLAKTFYVRPNLTWLSTLLGGAMFGVGMTLASGCGSRTLVRLGGGNLKSLVVLVFMGISAYMTLKGLFGVWRVNYLDPVALDLTAYGLAGQDIGSLLSTLGISRKAAQIGASGLIGLGLLTFVLKDAAFRRSLDNWLGGLGYGLAVVAGWYITAHIGYGENPETLEFVFFGTNSRAAESLSFVAPVAYSLELLMLWSDKSLTVSFGMALALGMVLGSFSYAVVMRRFRWEGFVNVSDMRHHILGGVLMGAGGVLALGCTIGQGISGLSTLAIGSFLALAAMLAGCYATLKYQLWKVMREG